MDNKFENYQGRHPSRVVPCTVVAKMRIAGVNNWNLKITPIYVIYKTVNSGIRIFFIRTSECLKV